MKMLNIFPLKTKTVVELKAHVNYDVICAN